MAIMSNSPEKILSQSERPEDCDLQPERPILAHQVSHAVLFQQDELQRTGRHNFPTGMDSEELVDLRKKCRHNFPAGMDSEELVDLRKKWSEKMKIVKASRLGNSGNSSEREQKVFSLDCEMVGVKIPLSAMEVRKAAYVCVVDNQGRVVYLSHVSQKHPISSFYTSIHGIKRQHLDGAPSLDEVQRDLSKILTGNILLGHGIKRDLKSLEMQHPVPDQRDTQIFFMKNLPSGEKKTNLKLMALVHLHREIQTSSHYPAEDALAAMDLYLLYKDEVEAKATMDQYLLRRDGMDSNSISNCFKAATCTSIV